MQRRETSSCTKTNQRTISNRNYSHRFILLLLFFSISVDLRFSCRQMEPSVFESVTLSLIRRLPRIVLMYVCSFIICLHTPHHHLHLHRRHRQPSLSILARLLSLHTHHVEKCVAFWNGFCCSDICRAFKTNHHIRYEQFSYLVFVNTYIFFFSLLDQFRNGFSFFLLLSFFSLVVGHLFGFVICCSL